MRQSLDLLFSLDMIIPVVFLALLLFVAGLATTNLQSPCPTLPDQCLK